MRVILISSGSLGVPTLERLYRRLALVVTGPDTRAGRGLPARPTPVGGAARRLGCALAVTGDVNSAETLGIMARVKPEVVIVADFGQVLKQAVLDLPAREIINIHPSLLPRHRGATPVEASLLNRETETGVSIIRVTARLDAGPILLQEKTAIGPGENAPTLKARLAEIGAHLTGRALAEIESGRARFRPQDENLATWAPLIPRDAGEIRWSEAAGLVAAKVRAYAAWPRSHAFLPSKPGAPATGKLRLVVLEAEPVENHPPGAAVPGTVIRADSRGILVACGADALLVTRLTAAGRRPQTAGEFIRGHPFIAGLTME